MRRTYFTIAMLWLLVAGCTTSAPKGVLSDLCREHQRFHTGRERQRLNRVEREVCGSTRRLLTISGTCSVTPARRELESDCDQLPFDAEEVSATRTICRYRQRLLLWCGTWSDTISETVKSIQHQNSVCQPMRWCVLPLASVGLVASDCGKQSRIFAEQHRKVPCVLPTQKHSAWEAIRLQSYHDNAAHLEGNVCRARMDGRRARMA